MKRQTPGQPKSIASYTCISCKWFATVDYGYSSYTVEETMCHCVLDINPYLPCNESYSWDYDSRAYKAKQVLVAVGCHGYMEVDTHKEGVQIHLDVDGEVTLENYANDPPLYLAAKLYTKWDYQEERSF